MFRIGSEERSLKDGRKTKSCRESLLLSDSTAVSLKNKSRTVSMSCTSSLTSEGSSEDIVACRMRMIAAMARRHEMKVKVDLASALAAVFLLTDLCNWLFLVAYEKTHSRIIFFESRRLESLPGLVLHDPMLSIINEILACEFQHLFEFHG